jgi:pimeloyl-ACP methyl ester carboxylesterase
MRLGLIAVTLAAAAVAYANHRLAKRAEEKHRAEGGFVVVDGVRLHYLERGTGMPLVLLHGNGSMIADFTASGLFDRAAVRYRVIAFDRPGYGHSARPRGRIWDAAAQAELIHDALRQLGVERAIVLGHSWGCSVAMALALDYPDLAAGLVLLGGYYYAVPRFDALILSLAALPILGDVLRYTLLPPLVRLAWPAILRRTFAPDPVPPKFAAFPKEMAVRPSQIRTSAAEAGLMIWDAFRRQGRYHDLHMPLAILAGTDDRLIDTGAQSARLARAIRGSLWHLVPGGGHMIHHGATERVLTAIDEVAGICLRSSRNGAIPAGAVS